MLQLQNFLFTFLLILNLTIYCKMVEQVTEKLNNTNLDPENQAAASSQEQ